MEKWFIGTIEGKRDVFLCKPKDATPDLTGYEEIEGPYNTEEEAEEAL